MLKWACMPMCMHMCLQVILQAHALLLIGITVTPTEAVTLILLIHESSIGSCWTGTSVWDCDVVPRAAAFLLSRSLS